MCFPALYEKCSQATLRSFFSLFPGGARRRSFLSISGSNSNNGQHQHHHHQQQQHRLTYPCGNCGKQYNYHSSLVRHLKHECGVEPRFQCPLCPYRTKHRSSLNTHINGRHLKQRQADDAKPGVTGAATDGGFPETVKEGRDGQWLE